MLRSDAEPKEMIMSENTHTPAPHPRTVEVGGRTLTLETGKIAKQANGAITARTATSVVLTHRLYALDDDDATFYRSTVDYRGTPLRRKNPGGFFKREGRPSEKEFSPPLD